ncbi:hypothetical protein QYF61_024724 [Mycteria americana]|uniref:Uncharacterized protein n=1 Tax=Mycteria americana TaxID=33587 RepID=A0AAN7S115_MYCAM|nr:hypothetical protein QYF61_024724 [Mycteria americana]
MLMKGHYPYFTSVLTKALTSLESVCKKYAGKLSHAHLLLQLGGKARAVHGGADVRPASASVAAAVVLSSSRVWLGEKAGYWQGAKPWEWWCGLNLPPHSPFIVVLAVCDENKGGLHIWSGSCMSQHILSGSPEDQRKRQLPSSSPPCAGTSAVANFHPASKAGERQCPREKHEPRLRGIVGAERMRVLLSSGLLEVERAVAEVQDAGGLLSPAGLASGSPGAVVMLILPFPLYVSELMETPNGKKKKHRNEKSMAERRFKHARRDRRFKHAKRGRISWWSWSFLSFRKFHTEDCSVAPESVLPSFSLWLARSSSAVSQTEHLQKGWKRPLRSSSPTVNLALPSPPLHHVPKHHIYTSFKYLQEW